jgi:tetratricopeptide (TPR) repeat protein
MNLFAQSTDTVTKANQEYSAGNFPAAVELYKSAINAGETNAALFYNLGNACFRTGDFGRAILSYERALVLEPQHAEAAANLRLARDKARALELKPAWWDEWSGRLTPNQYSIAVAIGFWLSIFFFTAIIMVRRRSILLRFLALLALVVFAVSLTALWTLENGRNGRAVAIVTAKKIEARVATADNAGSVLVLPPGSEIKILNTRGDWIYAALPNDLRGWIPTSSAERVRL